MAAEEYDVFVSYRRKVAMDPADLLIAEQMTHPARRGTTTATTVRLPEEDHPGAGAMRTGLGPSASTLV